MEWCDGLINEDHGLRLGLPKARRAFMSKWSLSLVLSIFVSISFSQEALSGECEINGLADFFVTPCDLTGTYTTPSSRISGVTASGADLTLELVETSTSIAELGPSGFPILQTRILMTYTGTLHVPIVLFDTSRPVGDRVVASSRVQYFISGAIEWREDVRGGTGRIEGGAWTPENPPGVDRTRVAGRAEFISFEATLDMDSLPCCQRVGVTTFTDRLLFIVRKVDDAVQTDLGLGRGLSFTMSVSGSALRNCGTSTSCGDDFDSTWSSPSSIVFDLGAVKPLLSIDIPKGTLKVRLKSTQQVETLTGDDIQQATLQLFNQAGHIQPQRVDESDEDFRQRLTSSRSLVDQCINCDLTGKDGRFTFEDVPMLETVTTGGSTIFRPAYYTVEVTDAESEEVELASEMSEQDSNNTGVDPTTNTLLFTNELAGNIRPDPQEPFVEKEIALTRIDEIGKKEKLVKDLSKIGPNNYSVVEGKVQQFLEKVKSEKTPEQLEAVRRGILAERLTLSSAKFADQLITTMLGGLEKLIGDVIDDFLSGKNKDLATKEKDLKNLGENLQAGRLREQGWEGFSDSEGVVAVIANDGMRDMVEGDNRLVISFTGKALKAASDGLFFLINKALIAMKVDKGTAGSVAESFKAGVDTMLGIAITQGLGSGKALAKLAIKKIIKSQKDGILDAPVPFSFTSLTEDSLKGTLTFMKAWETDNKEEFLRDRSKFNKIDQEMGNAVLVVSNGITSFSTEISDALGGIGINIIELLGPQGRATAKVAKVVKYVSNITTIAMPFITIYGIMGGPNLEIPIPILASPLLRLIFGEKLRLGLVEKGSAAAFGRDELPSDSNKVRTFETTANKEHPIAANSNLLLALDKAQSDLTSAMDELNAGLQDDRILDAITSYASNRSGGDSFIHAFERYEKCVSHIMATSQDQIFASEKVGELIGNNVDLMVSSSEMTQLISDMFFKVLLLEYTGPNDPLYRAERNHVLSTIESFRKNANSLALDATSVFNETKDSITLPAVVVDSISISSDTTGGHRVNSSKEDFTLIAHLKNISTSGISGVSVMLTVTSMENSIVVSTPLEMTVGSGGLEADDGTDGTGLDEANVVWRFKYNGDPSTEESILFSVDILEDGDTPVSFRAFSDAKTLQPDITLTDHDLDGMPDDWERSNGLDDTKDDSQDDKDQDGLSNQQEFDLGTDPQNPDTDGDGLSDGEETTGGADGFVTDALVADTDGDGIPDGADGSPLDGGTSQKPNLEDLIGEPVVSVDKTVVNLTKDEPIATISVTNSGTGTLTWTAVSMNDALAIVTPSAPGLRNGDGTVLISAPAGFDFDAGSMLQTTIRVIDLTGATHDSQTIAVVFGDTPADPSPNQPTTGGGQTGSSGGVCGAMGMIMLPMTALSMLSMRLFRTRRGLRRR